MKALSSCLKSTKPLLPWKFSGWAPALTNNNNFDIKNVLWNWLTSFTNLCYRYYSILSFQWCRYFVKFGFKCLETSLPKQLEQSLWMSSRDFIEKVYCQSENKDWGDAVRESLEKMCYCIFTDMTNWNPSVFQCTVVLTGFLSK